MELPNLILASGQRETAAAIRGVVLSPALELKSLRLESQWNPIVGVFY